ncbi:MAG TPA: acyl-CoA dehydrogenase family protein [Blastocatellia bacterium]|nr:acyl-CoA dehydrogenase family protein [Blastocatellia bacterium]
MDLQLSDQQEQRREDVRQFCLQEIVPHADQFDRQQRLPPELIDKLAGRGYLGSFLAESWGGSGLDLLTYGLLTEEIGKACSSVRSLLTVHDMVATAILRWGNQEQRAAWLPLLASGQKVAAFAASEPDAGSDLRSVQTTAVSTANGYVLNGLKKWITFGQVADLFLVLARLDDKPSAFLVERHRSGLSTRPIGDLLGVRASMLAEVELTDCRVPASHLLGRAGFGLASVISTALGMGRYSVAWGCVGIAQACLDACVRYTSQRRQFGAPLKEHQLIRQMISDMVVNVKAARMLCCRAACLKISGDPREVMETLIAKYFASQAAMKSASDAVQIHGANGCGGQYPVQRYMRDAKIMEIIEGSNQLQQLLIADYGYQEGTR